MSRVAPFALALLAAACAASGPYATAPLASARVAADADTYALHRVGLVPVLGRGLDPDYAGVLHESLAAELADAAPFETVSLGPADLEEVPPSEPHRRGAYPARTILEAARRFRLDGVLIVTVSDVQMFRPLRLGLRADLIAAETGAVVWSASVALDAQTERTREGLEAFYAADEGERWELSLLSPRRFARFAAHELARALETLPRS